MIVDSSALVAIVRGEPDGPLFLSMLVDATAADVPLRISASNLFEVFLVVDKDRNDALSSAVDRVLQQFPIEVVAVTQEHALLARAANRRFGRGSGSKARLNFGDCFAYALAQQTGEPLLFKGDDFAQTDVVSALK